MGTAGSGKTVIGSTLAAALGVPFVEGDAFHPPDNVEKMRSGRPLDDTDRHEWLLALGAELEAARDAGTGVVMSCSALKRRYRDLLRAGDDSVRFIFLTGEAALLRERLQSRTGHYMPVSLLDSQLDALEVPATDEGAWTFDIRESPATIVASIMARLADSRAGAT